MLRKIEAQSVDHIENVQNSWEIVMVEAESVGCLCVLSLEVMRSLKN